MRSNTELYDIVLGVFDAVQYGTPCYQDFVPITVAFSFVQGKKTYKRKNTHNKKS